LQVDLQWKRARDTFSRPGEGQRRAELAQRSREGEDRA
jgi:hypothetical protein